MRHGSFCHLEIQSRRGFVRDHQFGIFDHSGGDEHSSVHSSGKFKRIQILHFFLQLISFENIPKLFFFLWILAALSDLRTDLHQRIQKRNTLGNHHDLRPPKFVQPLFIQGFSAVGNRSSHGSVVGKHSHDAVCQKALSRTAGAHDCHHLPCIYLHIQIPDHRKLPLMKSPVILGKTDIHMLYF